MILVTGGAGLVGRELITQLLADGKKVTAIYNKTELPDFNSSSLKQVQCNILDITGLEELMLGTEEVYHCAAVISFHPKRKFEMFKVNVEGTANVVNAAINAGVKKMLFVSSVSALGRIRTNEVINETMNWTEETSNSNYGESKYLAELEVWRGIAEGLKAVIVNPVIILGYADWNYGSSKLFKSAYDEFPWFTTGSTGFVDARDVAGAMKSLMEKDISGERFILSAENSSYRDVFIKMAQAFGKKPPHKRVTRFLASLIWRLDAVKSKITGREPLITKETARTAMAPVTFENSKLFQFLPDFKYHRLDDTIKFTAELFQKNISK